MSGQPTRWQRKVYTCPGTAAPPPTWTSATGWPTSWTWRSTFTSLTTTKKQGSSWKPAACLIIQGWLSSSLPSVPPRSHDLVVPAELPRLFDSSLHSHVSIARHTTSISEDDISSCCHYASVCVFRPVNPAIVHDDPRLELYLNKNSNMILHEFHSFNQLVIFNQMLHTRIILSRRDSVFWYLGRLRVSHLLRETKKTSLILIRVTNVGRSLLSIPQQYA